MATTSIDVPAELRDRIRAGARSRCVTAAAFLADLLDRHERIERFASVKAAYSRLSADDDDWMETRVWEALAVTVARPRAVN